MPYIVASSISLCLGIDRIGIHYMFDEFAPIIELLARRLSLLYFRIPFTVHPLNLQLLSDPKKAVNAMK